MSKEFDAFMKYLTTTLVNIIRLALNVGLFTENDALVINCDDGSKLTVSYSKSAMTVKEDAGWHIEH